MPFRDICISVDDRLTTGTRLVVVDIIPDMMLVKALDDGNTYWLPRITFSFIPCQGVTVRACPVSHSSVFLRNGNSRTRPNIREDM